MGRLAYADISIVSLNNFGQPMMNGVCSTAATISDSGMVAFIAPMEDRTDSQTNGFHASFLLDSGHVVTLYPGYLQELAQFLHVYSKTTNVRLSANHDFTAFALIVEKIKSGSTPQGSDVTVPTSMGTWLAVVDAFGNPLQEVELTSTEGSVSASQCHVSFADNGKLLVACGQYIGLRLYDSPTTDLTSFTALDAGYKTGTAVITGDGSKVFFARDGTSQRTVCYVDMATGKVIDTGLTASGSINDAQVAVNQDGSHVTFRKTTSCLSICSLEDKTWNETIIDGTQIRSPAISADGRYVVYQARGASCLQIMEYDCQKGTTTLISQNNEGVEADADCTSPSISVDGSWISFISAASNLDTNNNGQPQLLVVKREAPSFTLELKSGWNLCALPFTADEGSQDELSQIGVCWGWNNGKFVQITSYETGQGFWIYSPQNKKVVVTGFETIPEKLKRGWNLIGTESYPQLEHDNIWFYDNENKCYVKAIYSSNIKRAAWLFMK